MKNMLCLVILNLKKYTYKSLSSFISFYLLIAFASLRNMPIAFLINLGLESDTFVITKDSLKASSNDVPLTPSSYNIFSRRIALKCCLYYDHNRSHGLYLKL